MGRELFFPAQSDGSLVLLQSCTFQLSRCRPGFIVHSLLLILLSNATSCSFNILIHTYGSAGMVSEMENALQEMQEAGVAPDTYTFNTLVAAYGRAEMPHNSVKVWKCIRCQVCVCNVCQYYVLTITAVIHGR